MIFLIQAGIHPGEIDGKDAGLMFIRDMVIHEDFPGLMDHVTYLFIPIFSVDGHERFGPYNRINQNGPREMGWRTTAQNLNLNRDYLKADSPEMQALLTLFQQWLPDFYLDIHVTDGADFQYVSTYEIEVSGNMDAGLTNWTKEVFIPSFETSMGTLGNPVFTYVSFRKWHDPRSGLRVSVPPPRISHGYGPLQNRPCLLLENHMLKDYQTRVESTYQVLVEISKILSREYAELRWLNNKADLYSASEEFLEKPFPIQWKNTSDSVMVEFLGVEYDIVESDLTGGPWFQYHPEKPRTYLLPLFNKNIPQKLIELPLAYIVPPEWDIVIERLKFHGIEFKRIEEPAEIMVETYRFLDPDWSSSPYEGRLRVTASFDIQQEVIRYPSGSVVVPLNQRASRAIAHIFEPDAPDSYLKWGFFNVIFEQKEYSETYVMEEVARQMIDADPDLLEEFNTLRDENPDFTENQWVQLNWFYSKSPWWDTRKNLYPVGRVIDEDVFRSLKISLTQ